MIIMYMYIHVHCMYMDVQDISVSYNTIHSTLFILKHYQAVFKGATYMCTYIPELLES